MRDPRLEELISAYVDGELTTDQQLLVERQLSESAEYRQLFEQLQRQQALLRSLPRHTAPPDLVARVLRGLSVEDSTPATSSTEPILATLASPEPVPAAKPRSSAWKVGLGVITALAAGLLIAVVLRQGGAPVGPPGPGVIPVERVNPPVPIDQLATVEDFQRHFKLLLVLDIAISPKGQEAKVLDQSLKNAGIPMEESVAVENRLEKDILSSRFIGEDKITSDGNVRDVSKDSVEMVFIRAKMGQIEAIQKDLWRMRLDRADMLHVRMDLAMATKELEIFLNLNNAVDGGKQTRVAKVDSWSKVGAHRLQFPMSLHSVSLNRLGAFTTGPTKADTIPPARSKNKEQPVVPGIPSGTETPPDAATKSKNAGANKLEIPPLSMETGGAGMDPNQPSQMLLIVRNLKQDF